MMTLQHDNMVSVGLRDEEYYLLIVKKKIAGRTGHKMIMVKGIQHRIQKTSCTATD